MANQNDGRVFFTAHEKGFKFHAQRKTGAYSRFKTFAPSLVYKTIPIYTTTSKRNEDPQCFSLPFRFTPHTTHYNHRTQIRKI